MAKQPEPQEYEQVADEIDQDRETRVVAVTEEGVVVENIFTGQQTTATTTEEALRWSHRQGKKWEEEE